MIAQITYAHHIDMPGHSSGNGIEVRRSDNWILGAAQAVTVFIVEPESFGTEWKRALTLYFPFNSAKLTAAQIREIGNLPPSAHYRIVGSASYPGSDRYNYDLGLHRSQAVAALLKKAHARISVMVVSLGNAFASPQKDQFGKDQKAVVQIPGK